MTLSVLVYFDVRDFLVDVCVIKQIGTQGLVHGISLLNGRKRRGSIILNAAHWSFMSPETRWELMVHEACHIVAFAQTHGMPTAQRKKLLHTDGHGPLWVDLMARAGATPNVTGDGIWTEERVRYFMPRRKYRMTCEVCGHRWGLTKAMAAATKRLGMPPCNVCKGNTVLTHRDDVI